MRLILTVLSLCTLLLSTELAAGVRKPNIVFIMVDDLGYGDLGCYGQTKVKTPCLDRLAAEGRKFTQFYAGSTVCAPSRCVLMTGRHTGRARIRGNGGESLRPEDVTVAEVLKGAGYTTGLVGKWGLGREGSTGVPTKQGFDSFFGYLHQGHAHNYYPTFLVENEMRVKLKNVVPKEGKAGQGVASEKIEYSHDLMVERSLAFIDRHRNAPFFLYLAWTIPHANNEAGKKGMEVPDLGIYEDRDWPEPDKGFAAMVSRMDRDVGKIVARLQKFGLDENTIIFFTSDNGPHREGGHDPNPFASSGPLRGIKRDLYEGGIRVPMIVRWPGVVQAGTTSSFIGAFWDVLPTLAELAGVPDRVPASTDGLSFAAAIRGRETEQKQHDALYWAFYERGGAQAVRQGKWKAVVQPMHTPLQLYDLEADIGEARDVAARYPEIVAKMTEAMQAAYTPSERWSFRPPGQKRRRARASAKP